MNSLEPIALVGISCEFAGDIHSPVDFWQSLQESRDLSSDVREECMNLKSAFLAHMLNQDNNGNFEKKFIRRGYFLSTSQWDTFEPSFFGLSDGETGTIDPCHRLLMLKFVHLLEDAGYTMEKMRGSQTSVHIAQFSGDHSVTLSRLKPEQRSRFHGPNTLLYNAAARLSYHFDLRGPNLSMDVACSGSLQALHLAVQALRAGEADMAVCGGVNSVYTPENLLHASILGAMSPEGRSRSFSADANGYAKGEGLGLVLLKRLSDAERDGDRIYCVIRDILSNHDGCDGKNSYVVPSESGQQQLLNQVYSRTQYDPSRIFYVEAHGTGTLVGDPIEANTLGRFFNRSSFDPPLLIGSVKSNIGHTEGTAGVASLIKAALCMRYRAIPPNLNFSTLNPKIEAKRYNLHVVQSMVPFPSDDAASLGQPVALGINSFGIGGNNAHAIIEEYKQPKRLTNGYAKAEVQDLLQYRQHFLFVFSSKRYESLQKQIAQFNVWLQHALSNKDRDEHSLLMRISQHLLLKRTLSYEHFAIFVSSESKQLQEQVASFLAEQPSIPGLLVSKSALPFNGDRRICFVFSGQGPQWWAMGRQLYTTEPIFQKWIKKIDEELIKVNNNEWSLLHELIEKNSEHESRINDTNIAQPALFAVQVGLAALLVSWHILPSAIVSHSAGEQAAAFVAGRISLEEAVRIVYHRSRLQHRNTRQGGRMLAVGMSEQEAREHLLNGVEHLVCVAVINSPRSITLSGEAQNINEIQQILTTFHPNVFKAQLRIENAFHSHQMDRFDIEQEMLSMLADIRGLPLENRKQMFDERCAHVPIYSSVTGYEMNETTPFDARYWWSNVRQCVRFSDAMQTIIKDEVADTFLELSPHPVLATSIRECCELKNYQALILSTLKRKDDEQVTLLTSLAQLSHSSVVWHSYFSSRSIHSDESDFDDEKYLFDSFPLYEFNKSTFWYESKNSVLDRRAHRLSEHPLLGVRQLTQEHTSAVWRSLINLQLPQYQYLRDHKIQDAILFPATGFIELAIAACHELIPRVGDEPLQPLAFEQVEYLKALHLTENELTEVFTEIIGVPIREWHVYSRSWSSSALDCTRTGGMAGTDVVESFVDKQILNKHAMQEYTLHARGRIDFGTHLNLYATSAIRHDPEHTRFIEQDINQVYAFLSTRGYQYGPTFRTTESLKTSKSEIIAHSIFKNEENETKYYMNPRMADGSCNSVISIVPGHDLYLPSGIGKIICFTKTTGITDLITHGTFHSTVAGVASERSYSIDMSVFDGSKETTNSKPICIIQSFKYDRVPGVVTGDKTVFEKVNEIANLPNANSTDHIDKIFNEYCFEKKWSPKAMTTTTAIKSIIDSFPAINTLIGDHNLEVENEIDKQLEKSLAEVNALASSFAFLAIKQLTNRDNNDDQVNSNKLEQYVRNDEIHYQRLFRACLELAKNCSNDINTINSIQLERKRLLTQYPSLQPLLTVLFECGSRLSRILTGEEQPEDFLILDHTMKEQEITAAKALQQVQSILMAANSKTETIFRLFLNHIKNNKCNKEQEPQLRMENRLRIMFIGGGTSDVALPLLQQLEDYITNENETIQTEIVYTDVTQALLDEAKQIFEHSPLLKANKQRFSLNYHLYDIENDNYITNTIVTESFDIIFAANVLHTTNDRIQSLSTLRCLLVPGGLLFLVELTCCHAYFDLFYGLFAYWWRENDQRALLSIDQWTKHVESAGGFDLPLTVISTTKLNNKFGDSLLIIQKSRSRSILTSLPEWKQQNWLILTDQNRKIASALTPYLSCSNPRIINNDNTFTIKDICHEITEILTQHEQQLHLVFAWPLDFTIDNNDQQQVAIKYQEIEQLCNTLIQILQTIQIAQPSNYPFIYILTENAQQVRTTTANPLLSSLIGLARSLTIECSGNGGQGHRIKLIDLQPADERFVSVLARHMNECRWTDNLDEIILRQDDNKIENVIRLEWNYETVQTQEKNSNTVESQTLTKTIVPLYDADQTPFRLQVAPSRFLADLVWVPDAPLLSPPAAHKIHIRVHCVGLNFRDVLKASGVYPHTRLFAQLDKDQPANDRDDCPGIDFSGTVIRCSPDSRLKLGDRVFGCCLQGAFHSHLCVEEDEVIRVPNNCHLTYEQLASLPTAFNTALYSLKYRVHLESDHIVLVHAATGSTGQAFIQYCQAIGAHVIATAGTDEKRRFLREQFGLEHVFNSRDLSFVAEVEKIAPDGVDVVVNSLTGPLLQASVQLLAQHGHFVELGKRDIFDKNTLSLFNLRKDCTFHVIDLSLLVLGRRKKQSVQIMNDLEKYISSEQFKPIEPITTVEPSNVIEAFTKCNLGKMMGKIIIRLSNSTEQLQIEMKSQEMLTKENEG
ncbi:hypothetical protein I4U23_021842 [Adineta vaga]|nr:hypothetical protein I4U23_021842 [Adineta vaga]